MLLAINLKMRLRILVIARLFIAAFLLFCAQFVFPSGGTVFYAIIATVSFLSVFYVIWLYKGQHLLMLAYLQTAFDLLLESILIYYTGGIDSLFTGIYILIILSAGLTLSPIASFVMATGCSLCFIVTASLTHSGWAPPFSFLPAAPAPHKKREIIYMFYAGYVQITVFFLVAVLTSYFTGLIRKLQDKVRDQERLALLGEVASNIAHEIRNPLASISGSIELIAEQIESMLSEKQKKLLDAAVTESARIKRIFNGILEYARAPQLHYEEINIELFLDQILLLMQHQEAFSPSVRIDSMYRSKTIHLHADPECLKQVFMNIITNAFEAMPNGGVLAVDCNKTKDGVVFTLEDTGRGMNQETIKSLFIPFKTTKIGGTGLGMAQAYKIVSQHGGKVLVYSNQGMGTKINLILPNKN